MFRQANASSEFTGISKETTKATNSIKIFEEKYPIDINKLIERLHEPECITTLAACVESIKLDSSAVSYCLIVPTESKPLADRTQSLVSIIPKLLYIIELNTNVDCQLDTEMIATPSEGDPDHKVTVLKSFRENYSYHIRTTSTNIQIQALNNQNIFYNVFSTFSINTEQIDCRVYLFDSKTFLGSHYELAPHSIVPLDNESTGPLENSDNFDIHNQPESVENDISVHRHLLIDKLKHASAIPVVDEIRRIIKHLNGNVSLNSTETKLFRTRHGLSLINNLIHEATDDVNSVWYSCTAHEIEIYDEIIEDYIFNKCHESCMCPGDTDDALVDTRFTVKLSVLSSSINCTEPQPATSDCQPDDFSPTNRKDELEFICDKEEENKDDKFNILNQNHKLFEPSIDDDQTSKASNHLENNFICDKSVQIHEDALLFGSPRLNSDYESLELDEHIDLNQCSQCTNALKALVLSKSPNEKVRDLITFVKGAFHAKSGGIDADHLLTTVISLIVLAKPDGLISNIRYIERFSNRHRISRGEPAFCLTTVVAAITAIDEMYAARFEVDAEVAYSIAPNFDQAHSKLPNIQSSTVLKTQKMDFFSEKIKADYRGGKSPKVDAGVGDHNLTNQALISKSSCETHTTSEKSSKVTSSFMKTINSMPKAISNAVADTLSRSGWSGSSDPLPPANSKGVESGSASIKSIEDIKKRIIKGVSIEELTMSEVALALQDYSQIIRDQKTDGTR